MLPTVTIEGRVAMDPELRFAPSGIAVAKMRLVCSSRKKDENDKWVDDKTLWINATIFGQLAENSVETCAKGDLVIVVGRLQTDEWTTEAGEKRSQIVVIANSIGPSLQFRQIPHSAGRTERVPAGATAGAANDPWASAPAAADEPPF